MGTCLECNEDGDAHMVSCSECGGKQHRHCAKISRLDDTIDWRCKSCLAALTRTSVDVVQLISERDDANKAGSVRSVSSKGSSKKFRQIQAELDIVEEELAVVAEKDKLLRQRELLIKRRRSLLQQNAEIENCSTSSENSIRASRCNDWVQGRKDYVVIGSQNQNKTYVPQQHNQEPCNDNAAVGCEQENKLPANEAPRGETVSASLWLPGIVPLSSTADPHANVDATHTIKSTLRLTPEHIAARKGLAMELPKFTGRPEEWPLFLATYEQTTQLCGYSDEENLIRLRHALDGGAKNSVKSLLLNVSCVPQILSTLRMKFGRPELIIDILLNQIRDMPSPKESRLETIVDFAIEVQNVCATMKSAGMTNYLNNPELQQELVSKLPGLLGAFWGMHKATLSSATLNDFSEWLFQLAQGANSVIMPSSSRVHRRGGNINIHSEALPAKCVVCKAWCKDLPSCNRFIKMKRSEKWRVIRKHKLCKLCLLPHFPRPCTSGSKCNVEDCNLDHHPVLHEMASPAVEVMPTVSVSCNAHHSLNSNSILFRILPVILYGNGIKMFTYAFFDDGSSLSLIDEGLFKKLNIEGKRQPLCMRWTSNMVRNEDESMTANFEMSGADKNKRFFLKEVHTVKKLDLPLQTIDATMLKQQYKHLKDIPLASYANATPRILIGLNNTRIGQCLKAKEGRENEPTAEKTRLGWVVKGTLATNVSTINAVLHHSYSLCSSGDKSSEELLNIVRSYIVNDNSIDMIYDKTNSVSIEDSYAMKQLEKLTRRVGHHFETGLLWRCQETLPDGSFLMAKKRATILHKKMENDPNYYNILQSKMTDYISKGYARKLLPSELQAPRCWYLPIFPVINPNKPGKIRLVCDAAAKVDGVSLNSMLLKGPDQLTSLVAVIRKFRQKKVALGGDIAEMFHQVKIRHEDQQFQRFLWRHTNASKFETYVMTVMTFGASCSPSCAQYVKNKNAEDFRKQYPEAARCITENHYVDDMLDSVDTEEEAIKLAMDVKFVHSQAGFHIRNWVSNSRVVLEALKSTGGDQKSFDIEGVCAPEKVLGMWWDMDSDSFLYKISPRYKNSDLLNGKQRPTKREVLSLVMTVFDPLGLLGFYVVFAKVIFQETWRTGCGWDEAIGDEQFEKWLRWIRLLPEVEMVKIPRCYMKFSSKTLTEIEIHTFVDASEDAYAAVSYLRCTNGHDINVSLLGCKTKLAPIKTQSVPRLELQGAVLGARLAKSLGESLSLNINKYTFWSDSITVLSWLRSDHRRYKQFVAFRVSEILDLSELNSWRWVPTHENVADEATKWKRTPEFTQDSRWLNGPLFLKLGESEWPKSSSQSSTECTTELRPCYVGIHMLKNSDESSLLSAANRIGTWNRLVRTLARILHGIKRWKGFITNKRIEKSYVTCEDISAAEKLLFKEAQKVYEEEIILLAQGLSVPKSSSLYKLSPYIDAEGCLRLSGRTKLWNGIDPIIMPRKHRITKLIISDFHSRYHHGNNETVVNELRQKFWIPNLRSEVFSSRKSCQRCRNGAVHPKPPRMGNLHSTRLAAFCRPFSYVGVDYFGPLIVAVRRSREKRYGVLVTCLTTRAIHLEIAHSLSTDSCIIAMRNFIARRGTPLEIWSDNGTNFKGAERELSEAFAEVNKNDLIRTFTTSTTKWNFIPPASPHMGGAWERLVRSVKNILDNVIASRTPTDELLRAAFMEVEMTVNSRPLTYIPVCPDTQEALTPNHFILGSSNGSKPLIDGVEDGVTLRRTWLTAQQLANMFWKRWVKEYLPIITRRSKWFDSVKPIELGDVVYIVDPANPRNCWPKGIVQAVHTGADGQVRSAVVRTSTGMYTRPATMIAVLDVKSLTEEVDPLQDIPGGSVK